MSFHNASVWFTSINELKKFSAYNYSSCSVNWESQTLNATSYIVFLFIFGLVLPVIVIVYSYLRIILTMKKNNARAGRVKKVEGRVTSMIFLMIIGETFALSMLFHLLMFISKSFFDSVDALRNICAKRTVRRSWTHHSSSRSSASSDSEIEYLLQSTDLRWNEFTGEFLSNHLNWI